MSQILGVIYCHSKIVSKGRKIAKRSRERPKEASWNLHARCATCKACGLCGGRKPRAADDHSVNLIYLLLDIRVWLISCNCVDGLCWRFRSREGAFWDWSPVGTRGGGRAVTLYASSIPDSRSACIGRLSAPSSASLTYWPF